MVFSPYLAMTAAEMGERQSFPLPLAWMACHFSPYGTGIINRPQALPEGSMLILNDRMPVCGHDPERVARQLEETAQALRCSKILLDFQRPNNEETAAIVRAISRLPLPVGVTEDYAKGNDCAVFLPPLPLTLPLSDHIAPWQGRNLWLELAPEAALVTVTESGSVFTPCMQQMESLPYADEKLHCRYGIQVSPQCVRFSLQRDAVQLQALMQEGMDLGISCFVGLYQDLGSLFAQEEAQATALDQF